MIEKLSEYKITRRDGAFINVECNTNIINTLVRKINELVEFCNDIGNARSFLERHEEQITKLNDAVNEIMTWRFDCDDGTPAESVQDKFAEQRKWIGKLCKFWFADAEHPTFGILDFVDAGPHPEPFHINCYESEQGWYPHCEPVKPDDSIIYKG